MMYFSNTKIALTTSDNEKAIQDNLKSKFTIKRNQAYCSIIRDQEIGNRGILRIFFPIHVSKITVKEHILFCKTKLNGLESFILFMSVGAILIKFVIDRNIHPSEYPILSPICIFVWYIISILIEAFRIKKVLTKTLG